MASSKIIHRYILREILGSTILCTLILTVILLYGNLSKHDEDLFRALSISPVLFLELVSLMLPFALSLGLPFGFSLGVIFCVGRWSADREIIAMQALGIRRAGWTNPIFLSSLLISLLGSFASLHWSPLARGAFEHRVREIAWHDFQNWIDSGREIGFKIDQKEGKNLIGGLDAGLHQKMEKASLSIGHGDSNEWKNVRILIWGQDGDLLAILHAKRSTVVKDREAGEIELFLYDVDYESFAKSNKAGTPKSSFVSFQRWKQPMRFTIDSPSRERDTKRLPLLEFIKLLNNKELDENSFARGLSHFNKYASIGCSPISLCPLLIFVAVRSGRRETYANLFIGVLICLLYFSLGTSLGQSIGSFGYGWWLSNLLAFCTGFFVLK